MQRFKKYTAILLIVLTLGSALACGVLAGAASIQPLPAAAEEESETDAATETPAGPAVTISASSNEVTIFNRLPLTATVTGVEGSAKFTWKSSSGMVALVNSRGVVTGLTVGRTTITVTAKVGNETLTDSMDIYVVQPGNSIHNTLRDRQILGYQYSYKDDYYYTNNSDCWQKHFGFCKFYDLVAPYIMLEYDYVRVFFTYGGKDWMIQFWKGQYGMLFYGAEQGVYTKRHSRLAPSIFTMYKCATDDRLDMDMTLYHDTTGLGTYKRELSRDYGKYWWCTGFKRGHLRVEEPARELRTVGTITLRDAEMTKQFADGLLECGFIQAKDAASLGLDQFYVDGNSVHFIWQNISEAETTMPFKVVAGANVLAAFLGPFALALVFMLDMGLLILS